MLTNCKSALKPIVKVINFCGCVAFYLHSSAIHIHHAKYIYYPLPFTAIKRLG